MIALDVCPRVAVVLRLGKCVWPTNPAGPEGLEAPIVRCGPAHVSGPRSRLTSAAAGGGGGASLLLGATSRRPSHCVPFLQTPTPPPKKKGSFDGRDPVKTALSTFSDPSTRNPPPPGTPPRPSLKSYALFTEIASPKPCL